MAHALIASSNPTEPAVTVVDISDPTAAGAGIDLLDQDVVQLRSVPLRARRIIVRLRSAALVFHSANLPVRTRTSVRPGLLGYVTFGPRAKGTVNGLPVRPGLMLAAAPASEALFVVDAGWESLAFLVPPQDIRHHLALRQREAEFHVPDGLDFIHADPASVRGLFDWGKRLAQTAARHPARFDEHTPEHAAAHAEMMETLVSTLRGADDFSPDRSDRTRQAHMRIVKAAEDYARTHAGDHLYVSDLCRAAAVSERTLEYAFKEITGLTPMSYLTRFRLHRVRETLLAASRATTTVSAVARNWGFWHFGDFSRAYKACFNELPSETLRRRAAERAR